VHLPLGTLVNTLAVICAGILGLLLRRALPERIRGIVFQAIGLFTIMYGLHMTLQLAPAPKHLLALIFSLLIGGIIGEALSLEARLDALAEKIKQRLAGKEEKFSEGLVTAFLIFCIGPMTIVGSINDGLKGDPSLLYAKSMLDFFTGTALAASFGAGVLVSALPLFVFQLLITLVGVVARDAFTEVVQSQLTAVGGVLVLGLGIRMLELAKLRVTNLLPSLLVIIALTLIVGD
jgi:uncharacterized membrane protein YqgA involved in biofilm formation